MWSNVWASRPPMPGYALAAHEFGALFSCLVCASPASWFLVQVSCTVHQSWHLRREPNRGKASSALAASQVLNRCSLCDSSRLSNVSRRTWGTLAAASPVQTRNAHEHASRYCSRYGDVSGISETGSTEYGVHTVF